MPQPGPSQLHCPLALEDADQSAPGPSAGSREGAGSGGAPRGSRRCPCPTASLAWLRPRHTCNAPGEAQCRLPSVQTPPAQRAAPPTPVGRGSPRRDSVTGRLPNPCARRPAKPRKPKRNSPHPPSSWPPAGESTGPRPAAGSGVWPWCAEARPCGGKTKCTCTVLETVCDSPHAGSRYLPFPMQKNSVSSSQSYELPQTELDVNMKHGS